MRRTVRAVLAVAFGVLLMLAPTVPASAVPGFGAAEEVVRPGCRFGAVDGDAAVAPDSSTRGFVAFRGGTGLCAGRVWYVERRAGRWSRQLSPYVGQVLAVAADNTGTYVLYRSFQHGGALRVGKRRTAGRYTGGRQLSAARTIQSGAIVASGGRWWAVWPEETPGRPEHERSTDLYQAKTLGRALAKQRVTTSELDYDGDPSLLLRPGGEATLAWAVSDFPADLAILGVGRAGPGGRWRVRHFELTRPQNFVFHGVPDLALDGATTHLIWERAVMDRHGKSETHLVTAYDRGGWGPAHTFPTRGFQPRIAASGGKVVAGWTTGVQDGRARIGQGPSRVYVVQRPSSGGTWTGGYLPATSRHPQRLLALTSAGGKAAALIAGGGSVYARTQR
jgi:hypothetical protein